MWDGDYHRDVIKKLDEIIKLLKLVYYHPAGIKFVFKSHHNKKETVIMADVILKQGQSVSVELHYVDASGNDLGVVPASDSPSFSVSDPASLSLKDGVLSNTNSGNGDVTESLSASAKGFTTSASITCAGVEAPPVQPAGVKLVFGTPTP